MKALPILFLLLSSCVASSSFTKLNSESYPSRPKNCSLKVYAEKPERAYETIGLINGVSGQTAVSGKSLDSMLPTMKKEACKAGAHALVLRNVEEGGTAWIQETQGKASAAAIRYKETLPGDPWAATGSNSSD